MLSPMKKVYESTVRKILSAVLDGHFNYSLTRVQPVVLV